MNGHAHYVKPPIWWRIAWWRRWPWRPTMVPPDQRPWGTQPHLVTVRENGTLIGWHPVNRSEVTTFVVPSRWACLLGVIKPPQFEVEISRDPDWRAPKEGIA